MSLNAILGGLGGVEGIISGFGASRRLREAQEARERLLNQIGGNLQQQYQQTQEGNLQALRRSTGLLGDSLRSNGSDLGAGLAAAGVSNSSATAGALTKNAANAGAQEQGLAQQNFNSEQNLLSQQQDKLNNLRLGNDNFGRPTSVGANADILNAQSGAAGAWQGVANLGTSLSSLFTKAPAAAEQPVFGSGAQAAIDSGGRAAAIDPAMATGGAVGGNLGISGSLPMPGVTTNPMGLNIPTGGGIKPFDATQSLVQTKAAQLGAGVGNPGVGMIGAPMMNGTMNKGMGSTTLGGYRRLF